MAGIRKAEEKRQEKEGPVAAPKEGAAKQAARGKKPWSRKEKTSNQTAPVVMVDEAIRKGVGEIQLRGLKIEAVDKEKGVITLSLKSPAPDPPSEPKDISPQGVAPVTEIVGKVVLIRRSSVLVDIGESRNVWLNITSDMARKVRWAEQLALVVEKGERTTAALTPVVEEELAGRAPSRKPMTEFEVGVELDGFVTGVSKLGASVDAHGVTDVLARWSDIDDSVKMPKKKLQPGERVRLNVTQLDVKSERVFVFVAILGEAAREAVAA